MTTTTATTAATTDRAAPQVRERGRRLASSVRVRLVGSIALLSALGLVGAGLAALLVERERIEARVERSLAQEIGEFTELAGSGTDPRTGRAFVDAESVITAAMQQNVPDENETLLGFLPGLTIVPVDGGGALQRDGAFRARVAAFTAPGFGTFDSDTEGRVVFAVMPFTQGGQRNHFATAYFLDRELAELGDTIRSYAVAATFAWAVLVLAAWGLAGRVLRPIRDLQRTSRSITDSDLSRRIDVRGHDEVAELGRTVNDMLDRLEDALDGQRRMLDDAGHELRTPLTVIRGHLELMAAGDPADVEATRELVIDELDRMGRLVEDLLVLAKARRPDFLRREPVDVGEVVATSLDKATALAPRTWVLDEATEVVALVDPARLTQVLLQLAANAVAATREGDTVAFGCAAPPGGVRVWVRDTGPGVAPECRERVFRRFESGPSGTPGRLAPDDAEPGTGLGLAIVAAIVTAHGGTVSVTSATATGGALFVIDLPLGHEGPASLCSVDDLFDLTGEAAR